MNSRDHLDEDIARIEKVVRRVGGGVWGVAGFVMICGVFVSFGPLASHGIPAGVAWMPSLAADVAMSVAIIAGPILARYDISAGWIGVLRWFAAFATWALQTAGPWLHHGGPDWAGVALHSIAPALLFFVGEGASYFVRRMSGVLIVKRRELSAAEQRNADDRAERAESAAQLRATAAELVAARAETEALTARLEQTVAEREAESHTAVLTAERLEAEIGALRSALTEQAERFTVDHAAAIDRLTGEHTEALRRLKEKHAERLTAARAERAAENGAVNLTAYRTGKAEKASPPAGNRPQMSDEDAVQAMFDKHRNPAHEWSQNSVRTLTGAGFGRIPNLIAAWRERAVAEQQRALTAVSGEGAVNE